MRPTVLILALLATLIIGKHANACEPNWEDCLINDAGETICNYY